MTEPYEALVVRAEADVCPPPMLETPLGALRARRPAVLAIVAFVWRLVGDLLPLGLLVFCIAGIAVRVVYQDSVRTFATFYYATPTPVLAGSAFVAGGLWLLRRKLGLAAAGLALSAVCGVWSYQTTWFRHAPVAGAADARVLFWNVARGAAGWSNIARAIEAQDADVVGLVEAGEDARRMAPLWSAKLPQYQCFVDPNGIALLAKGAIEHCGSGSLAGRGVYEHCRVRVGDDQIHVFVVDLRGEPQFSRRRPLAALTDVLHRFAGQRVIVMGDFNTPTDSVFLSGLRRDFNNAFEVAGNGCAATWPAPLPVLTIDHMWTSSGLEVHRCEHRSGWISDHRAVLAEVAVR